MNSDLDNLTFPIECENSSAKSDTNEDTDEEIEQNVVSFFKIYFHFNN